MVRKERLKNFEYLMQIMDEAEGDRDTTQGAFSFLWEGSYVREVVVTPGIKIGIAGLKTFLATEVLEIFGARNKSKVSYRNIHAHLSGDVSKKYRFSFEVMDELFDVEKNKKAFLERCWLLPEEGNLLEQIKNADILFHYLFMEKLRNVVWKKLRAFFKLCGQEPCNECSKKREMYFQFIQAVALYEIFLIEFVMARGTDYTEQSLLFIKEFEEEVIAIGNANKSSNADIPIQREEAVSTICKINEVVNERTEKLSRLMGYVKMFQALTIDFGISYNAMCYLLMVFEAMNVCSEDMRDVKKISLKIMDALAEDYEKNLEILQNHNKNRVKRYKKVNEKLEELIEKYGDENLDESAVIGTFIEELCKPAKSRNISLLRGLECKLGWHVFRDLGGKKISEYIDV